MLKYKQRVKNEKEDKSLISNNKEDWTDESSGPIETDSMIYIKENNKENDTTCWNIIYIYNNIMLCVY